MPELHNPAPDQPPEFPLRPMADPLEQLLTISVRRTRSGRTRAYIGRYDTASKGMTFEALSNPEVPDDGPMWGARALYNAAVEQLLDADDHLLPY